MQLFLLLNHPLTQTQRDEIQALGVNNIIDINSGKWSQIPPEIDNITPFLQEYFNALKNQAKQGDYLLIQGDYGATYQIVTFAKSLGLIPIYATTLRESKEIQNTDGSVTKQNIFRHCIFRKY